MSALGTIGPLRLVVTIPRGEYLPRELRQAFAYAQRESILHAAVDGRIENLVAEELLRVVPAPERA